MVIWMCAVLVGCRVLKFVGPGGFLGNAMGTLGIWTIRAWRPLRPHEWAYAEVLSRPCQWDEHAGGPSWGKPCNCNAERTFIFKCGFSLINDVWNENDFEKTLNPSAATQCYLGSTIQDPGSWIPDPGSRILNPGFWIHDQGSWIPP